MMKSNQRNLIAAAVAMLSSTGASALELNAGDYKFTVNGNINVHYVYSDCDSSSPQVIGGGLACTGGGGTAKSASARARVTPTRPSCAIGASGTTMAAIRSRSETMPLVPPSSSTSSMVGARAAMSANPARCATPAWPPKSAPRLFVSEPLGEGTPVGVDGPQAHYLARVMRVAVGDAVILCDNVTGEWAARVASAGKRDVVLVPELLLRPRDARAAEAAHAMKSMAAEVDWDKVQPVAAKVSSALIAAVASGSSELRSLMMRNSTPALCRTYTATTSAMHSTSHTSPEARPACLRSRFADFCWPYRRCRSSVW